ncbi:DUF6252 family protein [Flavobacterium silvaticum]|uniref:Lipoprotein n=1 Tax=Flavobacterium silvaticum TaxID=1852020 RepID=A0A972JI13_9FLAO|nr:DUF6252 family protein [Flavobacterium silvaticum]NMH28515.1 hypothetical protein [Flavobacterium silvaticum]
MKRIVLLLVAALSLASCTEEIQRNDQALIGIKNGQNWRAGGAYATIGSNGKLTITGALQYETLVLELNTTNPGTYTLGLNTVNRAIFTDIANGGEEIFSTGTGLGDGQVIIQEYNEAARTVTGQFRFNAIDEDALDPTHPDSTEVVNFTYGNFYKLPVTPAQ